VKRKKEKGKRALTIALTLTLALSRWEREFPPNKYQNIFICMILSYRVSY